MDEHIVQGWSTVLLIFEQTTPCTGSTSHAGRQASQTLLPAEISQDGAIWKGQEEKVQTGMLKTSSMGMAKGRLIGRLGAGMLSSTACISRRIDSTPI